MTGSADVFIYSWILLFHISRITLPRRFYWLYLETPRVYPWAVSILEGILFHNILRTICAILTTTAFSMLVSLCYPGSSLIISQVVWYMSPVYQITIDTVLFFILNNPWTSIWKSLYICSLLYYVTLHWEGNINE